MNSMIQWNDLAELFGISLIKKNQVFLQLPIEVSPQQQCTRISLRHHKVQAIAHIWDDFPFLRDME